MDTVRSGMSDEEYERRKKLLETIRGFSRAEQEEVYRILKKNQETVSENSNGLFFDLVVLKSQTIHDLEGWKLFCQTNRDTFEQRSKEIEALKND